MPLFEFASKGLCREHENKVWFPTRGHAGKVAALEAKKVCDSCPVLSDCREWGLRYERFGVWGGMTPNERWDERKRIKLDVIEPTDVELYG